MAALQQPVRADDFLSPPASALQALNPLVNEEKKG
jgi:hypothetical protein